MHRGELKSIYFLSLNKNKTYFFNVKENIKKDKFLNIVESSKSNSGYVRNSIMVYEEDLKTFLDSLEKVSFTSNDKINFPSLSQRREYLMFVKKFKSLDDIKINKKFNDNNTYEDNDNKQPRLEVMLSIIEKTQINEIEYKENSIRVNYEDFENFLKNFEKVYYTWED